MLTSEQQKFKAMRDAGLSVAQIAAELGIPHKSAEKRWYRIRRQIEARNALESSGYTVTVAERTPEQAAAYLRGLGG